MLHEKSMQDNLLQSKQSMYCHLQQNVKVERKIVQAMFLGVRLQGLWSTQMPVFSSACLPWAPKSGFKEGCCVKKKKDSLRTAMGDLSIEAVGVWSQMRHTNKRAAGCSGQGPTFQ